MSNELSQQSSLAAVQAMFSITTPILGLIMAIGIGVAYLRTYRTDIISTLKDNAEAFKIRSERIEADRDEYVLRFKEAQTAIDVAHQAAKRAAQESRLERDELLSRIADLERELGKKSGG